ncbi:hypothetical protein MRB53_041829 [Persea americana]|nr:hypothetical protein MRB53_041829 [Persea americana]
MRSCGQCIRATARALLMNTNLESHAKGQYSLYSRRLRTQVLCQVSIRRHNFALAPALCAVMLLESLHRKGFAGKSSFAFHSSVFPDHELQSARSILHSHRQIVNA